MKSLPVKHTSAEAAVETITQAQIAQMERTTSPYDAIHRIEVMYDMKQRIEMDLIRLEKSIAKTLDDFYDFQRNEN